MPVAGFISNEDRGCFVAAVTLHRTAGDEDHRCFICDLDIIVHIQQVELGGKVLQRYSPQVLSYCI